MALFAQTTVGVDITATSIRVVGIKDGAHPSFVGCKEVQLAEKSVNKEGLEDPAYIGKMIRSCLDQAAPKPIKSANFVTAVSEIQIFRKVLELPKSLNESEVVSAIMVEIVQFLPDEIEETELDYQILGDLPDGKTQQVMVIAVPKKIINQYVDAFQSAGLPLKAIDVRSSALGRGVVKEEESKARVLVNIEKEVTVVSIYESGMVKVTSTLPMGLSEEDEDDMPKQFISSLVDEIDHVVKFFHNRAATKDEVGVKEVELAGEGSLLKGLQEGLAKQTELTATVAKPVVSAPAFCDRRFLVALGCALYPIGEQA